MKFSRTALNIGQLMLSRHTLSPVLALLLSIISGAILFSAFGIPASQGFYFFVLDPLRDSYGISELLLKVSPILICAYGLLFCFKTGVWNIGAEGQYVCGAILGGWVALGLASFESFMALPLVLLGGALGGLLCAAISALLKAYFNVSVLLTTIMLNYISVHLLMFLVNGPLKDPNGFSFPESAIFEEHLMLPLLFEDLRLNISVFFPLVLMIAAMFVFRRSRFGFEITVAGKSESAAKNAGIPVRRHGIVVLLICGACAGLAGASEVSGPVGQLLPQLSVGYGYTAIICAYLGRMNPIGILFASLLLGLTVVGAESLQLEYELPSAISAVFQGLILFYLLASDYLIEYVKRRAASVASTGAAV